ncbi:MAG: alpha/beta hydrolase [Candidatus Rokuibacteriota bacterium]|nr:MAG: alpha/beta hydrolase [Candidatus Rokubacteria bacterium]
MALGVLVLVVLAAGCRSASERFLGLAADRALRAEVVRGAGFQHLVLSRGDAAARTLHIYLDGDGTPWVGGHPAADPTPRDPLVLDLLGLDPAPVIYLGRPCYHGLADAPACAPALWTSARYSEAVVTSMAAAARRVLALRGAQRIVWLGYSGGGTLAVLLAARLPETVGVITVAANLDIEAWADHQRSSRLVGSLNPARQPPLPPRVYQRHYAGGRDRTVPVEVTRRGAGAELVVVTDHDHHCCWTRLWPAVLAELERERERAD